MSATAFPSLYAATSSGLAERPKPRRSGVITRNPLLTQKRDLVTPQPGRVRPPVDQQDRDAPAAVLDGARNPASRQKPCRPQILVMPPISDMPAESPGRRLISRETGSRIP